MGIIYFGARFICDLDKFFNDFKGFIKMIEKHMWG